MPKEKYTHKILIVEDEVAMLNALTDNLKSAGFGHIISATDGQEGLELAIKEKPDIILLDIIMPRASGLSMLGKLRASKDGKSAKVIILTNLNPDESVMQKLVVDEPTYYLLKADFSIDQVIEKVKEVLGIEE